jgi:hypothetical protein
MNKLFIATVLAAAAGAASALEVGVTGTHDASANRNTVGVTVGNKYGPVGVTAGIDRTNAGDTDQNRYSLIGSYDITKVGSVTIDARLGVAYVDNQNGWDGYARVVGVGASVPLTNDVSATVDVSRQFSNVGDGNRITAGLKYKF